MKRILFSILALSLMPLFVESQMRYNPVSGRVYSYPELSENNHVEYMLCAAICKEISHNMKKINCNVTAQAIIKQCIYFLKSVDCVAAQRLAHDLKDNALYYPDGSYCWRLF